MSAYTIQRDPPWMPTSGMMGSLHARDYTAAQDISSPRAHTSYDPSFLPHPRQEITDNGPQVRHSRLPLFKHVRSMLHKPPPITTPSNPKWDEYTGELSDSGHPSRVQPSTYVSPYDGAFKSDRKLSPQRANKSRRDQSPVSILNDDELTPVEHLRQNPIGQDDRSPVSPVSAPSLLSDEVDDDFDQSMLPEPLSPNIQRPVQPEPRTPPASSLQIKRKPVSRDLSSGENHPPLSPQHSPSQSSDVSANNDEPEAVDATQSRSHFSWTTYADSVFPNGRASIDTSATHQIKESPEIPRSRFSWSTVATNATQAVPARAESPPPSSPPLPTQYSSPPATQSILSRRRPVQRAEEEWNPPPASARSLRPSHFATPKTSSTPTPTSASTTKPLYFPTKPRTPTSITSTNSPISTDKALPLPPHLSAANNNLTHLETLLGQERDIVLQRRNVERGIQELEKTERASPLDVPFSSVRDAKKRLVEYRTRLDEVRLEEREIGIAIARARRRKEKETGGDGETLWVRRVTG